MSLALGQIVKAECTRVALSVRQKLGEGGQGTVYRVESAAEAYALKWYNQEQATPEQKDAIRYLVRTGPPRGEAGARFIWPEDLVITDESTHFGYLMRLIDTHRFVDLGAIWSQRRPAPSLPTLCEISFQAANSYRALHLSGHCYRDISRGNLMFDPQGGDVLICDNDNIGVNRQSQTQVWGTLEYMAPELILGTAQPSTETDLHSLAVLLFNLWVWHHPMHGLMEYQFYSWDLPAKIHVYGKSPVFVFDPKDSRNRLPDDPSYATARRRWSDCPVALRESFIRAFGVGLREPARRVTEGEWQNLFLRLKDGTINCSNCQAENLWEPDTTETRCWHCKTALAIPPRLVILKPLPKRHVLLTKDATIRQWHLNPTTNETDAAQIVGQVVQNPANPTVWGIRNLTANVWIGILADGSRKAYPPQKAVPLNAGIKLEIAGATALIEANT